ncbi:Eukaryotic aspartyl protease family protein [Abeliophyllum distichum]|uniref:Eukaryotic aspartyl protease family protein n=1 Tax=Abeliophyllum distichum TaxID=126358 RepID=A0ABD1W104_9LAMI
MLEGNFVNGLKREIRAEVKLMRPVGLDQIMDVAQRVEDRNSMLNLPQRAPGPTRYKSYSSGPTYSTVQPLNKELQVLLINDDIEEVSEEEGDERREVGSSVELSINSVVGLTEPRTMKLVGHIAQKEVVVLIDSGATHNFISAEIVQQLGLTRIDTAGYGVLMGTGLTVKGEGMCKEVVLRLQNFELVEDFLPLELGSSDVILGMQWLGKLGSMQVDWGRLTMKFMAVGGTVTLRG